MTKAERIKFLRTNKDITQEELAKLLHTTKQTISKYENGVVTNIPTDKIERMAEIFGCTPEYISWGKLENIKKKNNLSVEVVLRMESDPEFFGLVESLCKLDGDKIRGINTMLRNFL